MEKNWLPSEEKVEEVTSLLLPSTKTESSMSLLLSSKESNKRNSNINVILWPYQKNKKLKKKQQKNRVGVAKDKNNSASTIDALMPPDTKKIIEEIPDLISDANFNEIVSDEFDNNLNSRTILKLN